MWCGCFYNLDFVVVLYVLLINKNNINDKVTVTPGTAALLAEQRKHQANDPKCHMLITPLAVESYGSWGIEARQVFLHLASRSSFGLGIQKPTILVELYGKLNITHEVQCQSSPQ